MKRTLKNVFVLALALLFCMQISAFAASDAKMEAVYGTPVIDGAIDDVWAKADKQDVALVDDGVIPSETATRGTFSTLWDENYFYVLVEVDKKGVPVQVDGSNENTADCADVCLTLNGNFDATLTAGGDDYAGVIRVTADDTKSGFGYIFDMLEDDYLGKMVVTAEDKYVVEYAIPWDDIQPKAGHILSLDIQINDATDGARTGLVMWASNPCYCWRESYEHGTIVLAEKVVETEAPATEAPATEAPAADVPAAPAAPATADMGIIAAAAILALAAGAVVTMKKR
ncbi:MAG: hypothetical protein J6I45_00450 [Clostridia bacterium]|nr:hypothetical protein [Clostridia bacterium]